MKVKRYTLYQSEPMHYHQKYIFLKSHSVWQWDLGSLRVNCAPEVINCYEEKGKRFLKHFMLNETLLWMLSL